MAAIHEYKELRDALYLIKDECSKHTCCSACPFAIENCYCGILNEKTVGSFDYKKKPQYWSLPEIKLMEKVVI